MVLHDIADDAKLVKVPAAALGAEGLLERNLHVVDVMPVPRSPEERVAKSKDEDILDHFLAEVVVNAEQLLLLPIGLKGLLQLARACQVLTKRLLNLTWG